jgi:hypothetical protein
VKEKDIHLKNKATFAQVLESRRTGTCYPQFLGITKEMMSQGPQVADMEYRETA